jgi:hypothetical protein
MTEINDEPLQKMAGIQMKPEGNIKNVTLFIGEKLSARA